MVGLPIALIVVVAVAVFGHFIDEPMRRRLEATLNQQMKGYIVKLPGLDFHPLGFSITLRELSVRQEALPDPPVMVIEELNAGVHWRALLRLALVADFELNSPRLHIDMRQLAHESKDNVDVEDKGWQEALESIYPLKINKFRVNDLSLTYVDEDPKRPLKITKGNFLATNIRNVSSPDEPYPSPIHLDAVIFDKGTVTMDGNANFLAVPHAGIKADVDIAKVPLERLRPVAIHANAYVTGGVLEKVQGKVEYAPKVQDVHLRIVQIDDIAVDYVHSPQTAVAEARRIEKVKEVAEEINAKPSVKADVDTLRFRNASFGFVNETTNPDYRVALDSTNLEVRGFTNRSDSKTVDIDMSGIFNGGGKTTLKASLLPRQRDPDLEMALQIENADMRKMNDLFRAYGNFDVVAGKFSFYTQAQIRDGKIEGYVKPLFADLNVYDLRQDGKKPVFHQLYEAVIGGVGELFENRDDLIATQATVSGDAGSPNLSTLEVLINFVRNAFFRAIMPGLEQAIREAGSEAPPPSEEQ